MTASERWTKLQSERPELKGLDPFTQLAIKWALIDANTDGYMEGYEKAKETFSTNK